jgi:arsenate reductase
MTKNILFLCTGNSARSILAESLVNDPSVGGGRFRAFSAGSQPKGQIHPLALATLQAQGHATDGLRSKSWDEFGAADAPRMDYVITVCDNAAAEVCPMWPGHPATEHWSLPDPAAVEGSDEDRRRAFRGTYDDLRQRIADFLTRAG